MSDPNERGDLRRETLAVRAGLHRSAFDETAEAMYLTSGYVYDTAGEAEATFLEEVDRYSYSRYAN
ncbi:MAG TPA: PLP-dependent transferase, partial [Candidatus Nanopelagicales bacterium]|nr:PLP-dependent transferase [Candidatus Nanopelagicales bacterium]